MTITQQQMGSIVIQFLNMSPFDHVTEGLVPDIMHDILEGVSHMKSKN